MNGWWIAALIILALGIAWWLGFLAGHHFARVRCAARMFDLMQFAPEIQAKVTEFIHTHPWGQRWNI